MRPDRPPGAARRRLAGAALAGIVMTSLLAGCSSAPPAPPGSVLSGRLVIQVAATASEAARSASGGFELRGHATAGQFELSGPLGATLARVRWSAAGVELDDGRETRRFASLEALTDETFGEPLPLQALFDWLRGRPWPAAASARRGDGAAGFEQLGWQIDTSAFAQGLLVAHRARVPVVSLRIRLDNPPAL